MRDLPATTSPIGDWVIPTDWGRVWSTRPVFNPWGLGNQRAWSPDVKRQLEEYTFNLTDETFLNVDGTEEHVFGPEGKAADVNGYEVFKGMGETMWRTRDEADRRAPYMQIHTWRHLQGEILEAKGHGIAYTRDIRLQREWWDRLRKE